MMKKSHKYLIIILVLMQPASVFSQTDIDDGLKQIKKGDILTSFNLDMSAAQKSDGYNHEFARSFELAAINIDGLYFVSDHIGLGPVLGIQYVHEFYDTDGVIFEDEDQWSWNLEYGIKAGYYVAFQELFKTDVLGESQLFATTGISWVRGKVKYEERNTGRKGSFAPETQFRYQIATGLFIPLGQKIGIEWRLQREAWKRDYLIYEYDDNGNIIGRGETPKWLSEIFFGLGLKIKF
ncbi:hypothetical protein [Gracilimonas tropica]|uniref:hypothetical protein n=1 Tax=Gracilimonas tropica TaxID=454600 RepID=UPI0012FB9149|nr:hypothetical protein [Gracilimonas tropica]